MGGEIAPPTAPTAHPVDPNHADRLGVEPYYIPPSIKLGEKAKAKRRAARAAPKR